MPMVAASAHAQELIGKGLYATDAQTGSAKLTKGHKIKISCSYQFPFFYNNVPAWRIRFRVDGKTIATSAGGEPKVDPNCKNLNCMQTPAPGNASAFWTPLTAGEHQAQCTLDSDGALHAAGFSFQYQNQSDALEVDIAPALSIGNKKPSTMQPITRRTSGTSSRRSGGLTPRHPGSVAPVPTAKMPKPHLVLELRARPIEGCSVGQAVVLVHGGIKNVGAGYAAIAPGKPVATVQSLVGVYGAKITSGNLSPGQTHPVSVKLKPKGFPAALAGATLKLDARINYQAVGKESSYGGNEQKLTVTFPADFCKPKLRVGSPDQMHMRAQPKPAKLHQSH
jgi:hypothetical protein